MPMPFAWQGVPLELGVWIGLYVLYAVIAVAVWAAVTRPWDRGKSEAGEGRGGPDRGPRGRQTLGASIAPPKRRVRRA